MTSLLRDTARTVASLRFSWRVRLVVLSVALVGYAWISLEPFRWSPPRQVDNGVEWTDRGTLDFRSEGLVAGRQPPDWLAMAIRENQLAVELRVRPAALRQTGEIFTIGRPAQRHFSISQKNDDLLFKLRRTCAYLDSLALPCTSSRRARDVFAAGQWVDISLEARPGSMAIQVDGETVAERMLPEAPLAVWSTDLLVALGNQLDADAPWLGEIGGAIVRVGDATVDLLDPTLYVMPEDYWFFNHNPRLVPFRGAPARDMLNNAVMYVPLGALLALLGFWSRRSGFVGALLVTGAVSLTMETTQIFFSHRAPSVTDLILNAGGGAYGFILIHTLMNDPRIVRLASRLAEPRLETREQQG